MARRPFLTQEHHTPMCLAVEGASGILVLFLLHVYAPAYLGQVVSIYRKQRPEQHCISYGRDSVF